VGWGGVIHSSIFSSDGTVTRLLVPLFDHASEPLEIASAPSLNNRGEVGFIGANNGALSIIVSDGVKTRIVGDTGGPFADFPQDLIRAGISLNNRGDVAFWPLLTMAISASSPEPMWSGIR
jgi:hypothetical protein